MITKQDIIDYLNTEHACSNITYPAYSALFDMIENLAEIKVKPLRWIALDGENAWLSHDFYYSISKDVKIYLAMQDLQEIPDWEHDTLESAQAACQKHYEQYILDQIICNN